MAVFPVNILERHSIIELGLFLVPKVAQAIPLTGYLGVESPNIIVDNSGWFLEQLVVKQFALEEARLLALCVKRPI